MRRHLAPGLVALSEDASSRGSKTALLHFCQHHKLGQPIYDLVATNGLQHAQEFEVAARLHEGRRPQVRGRTKRAVEKAAAERLLEELLVRDGHAPS